MISTPVPRPGPDFDSQLVVYLEALASEINRKADKGRGGGVAVQLRGPGDALQVYVDGTLVGRVVWNGTVLALA